MARLFFVQPRRSFFRCVLFAVFLELTIVSKCASSQRICLPWSKRNVSYFNVYNGQVDDWNTARQKCIAENSTLPVICNKDEQDALVAHLKGSIRTSAAWTSGKIIFTNWTWIDGTPFTGFISPEHESYTHIAFDKSRNNYKAADPLHKIYYLCQYSGSLCNSEHAINVTKGCIRTSGNDDQTWFNARRQCLTKGSDLAVLTDADLDTLKRSNKLHSGRSYWIGMQMNTTWHWMWLTTEKSSEDITYTKWSGVLNRREDECLSIDASNGEWKAVRCTDKKMVVCEGSCSKLTVSDATSTVSSSTTKARVMSSVTMAGATSTTGMYSSRPTTKTPVMSSITTAGAMSSTGMSEISTESEMNSISNGDSHILLYLSTCAGIAIIVICIIVVILAVRHTRKSPKMMDQSKGEIDSEHNERKESPNKQTTSLINAPANPRANTPRNAPAIAPAARTVTDDAMGVYAEITPLNSLEDEAKLQQPGIVYAALEFQKEPTYLEPGQKKSDQTKVGPMGDIYATPDAKGRAGNEATSHPRLVTSQGDVYALPLKNSKSPTANSPIGGIYANL